jgi:hypothetical protein
MHLPWRHRSARPAADADTPGLAAAKAAEARAGEELEAAARRGNDVWAAMGRLRDELTKRMRPESPPQPPESPNGRCE